MLNLTKQELDENLNFKEGFVVSEISSQDLEVIRAIVNLHWKKVLHANYPKKFNNKLITSNQIEQFVDFIMKTLNKKGFTTIPAKSQNLEMHQTAIYHQWNYHCPQIELYFHLSLMFHQVVELCHPRH